MIVRMAKVVIAGPLDLLIDTLSLLQELGIMQIADDMQGETLADGASPSPPLPDKSSALQHQFYLTLTKRIDELLHNLTGMDATVVDGAPRIPVASLAALIKTHIAETRSRQEKIDFLDGRIREMDRYGSFLQMITRAVGVPEAGEDVEYIGFEVTSEDNVAGLQESLDGETGGRVSLEVFTGEDSTLMGLAVTTKEQAGSVLKVLEQNRLHLFTAPVGLEQIRLADRLAVLAERKARMKQELAGLRARQNAFAARWGREYLRARRWLDKRLSLIKVTAAVVRTRMCFFVYGWLPFGEFSVLRDALETKFQGRVVVEEQELVEQDFGRIPTALHNPAYFKPFELFTRLLPLPSYASFDLTPFIGIFFPIFFGMMLGDIGYGMILLVGAAILIRRFRDKKNISDAAKILFVSSLYAMVFGWLYGECFGTAGHLLFGLEPVFFDRLSAVIPMLYFAVAAGVVHVIVGLVLGVIASLRQQKRKEAVFRAMNILFILVLCGVAVSHFHPALGMARKPLLLTVAVFVPVLLLTGGLMAPLELLKNVGNIISYARIMAVGLSSVLLAYVANYMAGKMGSAWAGILVALILHLFNLLLGVFAPTIHSLRLHYVEFLSKFTEPGGRKFTPLEGKK